MLHASKLPQPDGTNHNSLPSVLDMHFHLKWWGLRGKDTRTDRMGPMQVAGSCKEAGDLELLTGLRDASWGVQAASCVVSETEGFGLFWPLAGPNNMKKQA